MYVCVCRAVTDRQIREAAENGACSLKDLRRELGVTQDCGRCASCARECLHEARVHLKGPALPHVADKIRLVAGPVAA